MGGVRVRRGESGVRVWGESVGREYVAGGREYVAGGWECERLLDRLEVAVKREEVTQEVPDARAWPVGGAESVALAHAEGRNTRCH